MSKFIDKLEKVGQNSPPPLGFGPASRKETPIPQIALIGQASADDASSLDSVAPNVDAVLVSLGSGGYGALDALSESLKDLVWGVRVGEVTVDQVAQLKEKGCDFIVFDADNTSAAVLNDEELGKVIAITAELDEDTARAIYDLPIDAAMFSHEMELMPLTVQKLIDIQMVRCLVGKPFLMTCPTLLGEAELETFRDAEITGLVVSTSAADAIEVMHKSIANLPKRKIRSKSGDLMAQAPAGFRAPPSVDIDEGDEEDF